MASWMLARGASPDAAAAIDADGFGGHTPLFSCVVTQPIRLRQSDDFARLLLDHGANPNARASLRKRLRFVDDETMHEYRDVTPLGWGERFHDQDFVSRPAMALIAKRGGRLEGLGLEGLAAAAWGERWPSARPDHCACDFTAARTPPAFAATPESSRPTPAPPPDRPLRST